ncbi:MAG: type II secretion system protein [Candidatus Gastranaerophilales bacterium]|nr:type II secretion system protein [Candidatus Gastranaerophilales bacterium]
MKKLKVSTIPQLHKAFTLAEVLITLMVIGVIAVVTIPSLLQSWQERETVTKLKKTYSILQQAYKLAEIENGDPTNWNGDWKHLFKNINIIEECGTTKQGCFGSSTYKSLSGNVYATAVEPSGATNYKYLTNDNVGISFSTNFRANNCQGSYTVNGLPYCVWLNVDINGSKPPNQWGVDTFVFYLTKQGIFPLGGANSSGTTYPHSFCQKTDDYHSTYGCARWVIERGNMDYSTTW